MKKIAAPLLKTTKNSKKQPSLGYFRPFKAILGHSFSPVILICNSATFVVTIYLYDIPTYILVLHTKIYVPLPTNRNTISYMHRIPNSLCLCIFFLCMYVGGAFWQYFSVTLTLTLHIIITCTKDVPVIILFYLLIHKKYQMHHKIEASL